jgi:replicative DNA helicase
VIDFSFGQAFQSEMLALMLKDVGFALKVFRYIPAERLFSDNEKYLFERIKAKLDVSGTTPSYIEIEDHLKTVERHKRKVFQKFVEQTFDRKIPDPDFIKEKLTDYAKRNVFIDVFQTAQTFWNSKETDKAYQYTLEGINDLYGVNFKDDASIPIEKFEEHRQILMQKALLSSRKIPTMISPLDDTLRGGLEKGELGVILALPKKGKSIGLTHMGCAALMMRSGRVAHFVLEGTTDQAMLRYQSRLTQIPYSSLEKDEVSPEESKILDSIDKKYAGKLDLIPFNAHWKYTVLDVESKIKELKRVGRMPDLVIIDYADLLSAVEKYDQHRHEQTEVYRGLKRLAMMYNVAIWTASQAQRPSQKDEEPYLLRARDIAESYEKVRIADFVMTLNATSKEKDDGIMRLHIDIYRSNEADKTITMFQDYSSMIFYDKLGAHLTKEDVPDWMMDRKKK